MSVRKLSIRFLTVLTGILMVSGGLFAQSEAPARKPKMIQFSEPEGHKERYVAIMGEVNRPGTYHLDAASMNMHALLNRASGFTADASKVIRVIRNGRVTQNEVFSESFSTPLLPNDLLIVDPKPSTETTGRVFEFTPEQTTIHASYEERSRPIVIQVGLVNVAEYPVVLKLRPDDAAAGRIVEGLRQPIQLLADTDVITPGRRITSDVAKQMPRLIDGSVMVFKRASVNRSQLPPSLPKPIESDIALGAQAGLIGGPAGQSAELRSLGGKLLLSNTGKDSSLGTPAPKEWESPPPIQSTQIHNPATDLRSEVAPPPPVSRNARIATVPFSGATHIKNSSSSVSTQEHATSEKIPTPEESVTDTASLDSGTPIVAESSSIDEPGGYSLTHVLVVFCIVGMVMIAVVSMRGFVGFKMRQNFIAAPVIHHEPIHEERVAAVQGPFETRSLLERLIKNEMPIQLEEVQFPQGLMLQGRIAPRPILRVDGSQSILKDQGPHFAAPAKAHREVISEFDQAETPPVRAPHFIDAEKRKQAVDSVPQGSGDGLPKTPLAKALFELGKGGRS